MSTLSREKLIELISGDDTRDIMTAAANDDYEYLTFLIVEAKPLNQYTDGELLAEWEGRSASEDFED